MLIISQQRDYYDSVNNIPDKELVYNRAAAVIDANFDPVRRKYPLVYNSYRSYSRGPGPYYTVFVIGFCGKEYIGASLDKHIWCQGDEFIRTDEYPEARITFDTEEILEFIRPKSKSSWEKKRHVPIVNFIRTTHGRETDEIFLEHGTPAYVIIPNLNKDTKTLITNPVLKDLEFMKIMDPYTAFQELQMYLGDRLRQREKDVLEVSDEVRVTSRGFDKTSFRRESHPSKPRRRNKS